jgi:hypothetical protein
MGWGIPSFNNRRNSLFVCFWISLNREYSTRRLRLVHVWRQKRIAFKYGMHTGKKAFEFCGEGNPVKDSSFGWIVTDNCISRCSLK